MYVLEMKHIINFKYADPRKLTYNFTKIIFLTIHFKVYFKNIHYCNAEVIGAFTSVGKGDQVACEPRISHSLLTFIGREEANCCQYIAK